MKLKILLTIIVFIFSISILYGYKYLQKNTQPSVLNFLILGLDPRNDFLENTSTTDTIIFASYNSSSNKLKTISIPRDLWNYNLHQKINYLYPYYKNDLSVPDYFSQINNQFTSITGQVINYNFVITTAALQQLIEIVGGVDLYLDNGFKDEEYPNPAYIATPSSSISKYIVIEFKKGWVNINKNNIDKFVRSRKSSDNVIDGGTDLGRIQRQQLLISALIEKIKNNRRPEIFINLYQFWHRQIETNLNDQLFISLALKNVLKLNDLKIEKYDIPIKNDSQNGPIYYPNRLTEGQWAFIPTERDYASLFAYFNQVLN